MRTPAACQESRDALACPTADPLAAARVAAHRSRCSACRAYAEGMGRIGTAVQAAAAPGLDDIARARMAARLALAIDELATRNAKLREAGPHPARYAVAAALLLVASIGAVRWHHAREAALHRASQTRPPAAVASGPAAAAAPDVARTPAAPAPPLLRPERVVGMRADPLLERDTDHLQLPAGAVVHARLGPYARVTLFGPARLAVLTGGPVTAVRLDAGVLIGEYEHHPGGTLIVHSPAATTTVVGTLFSVEAMESGGSRVAVRRGAVVVQSQAERIHLSPGWSWSSGESAQPVISEPLVRQFAVHATGASRAAVTLPPALHAQPVPRRAAPSEPAAASSATQVAAAVTPPSRADAEPLVTADALYAQAEAAMRAGEHAVVRARLSELVRRFPSDGLADAALLELARLAKEEGQAAQARSHLDTLLSRHPEQALLEPARYLRCRLDVDTRQYAQAATCLTVFRRDFPTSAHDAEVLALLIGLWQSEGDCQRAIPLLDEYQRRYPKGPLDARVRRARCER